MKKRDGEEILEQLKHTPLQHRPHVVVLGAGASYATTPDGEKSGRRLPLMKDLADALELQFLLDKKKYAAAVNGFEVFFEELMQSGNPSLVNEIERRTYELFDSYKISDSVTIYDRLVLSLRAKDTIVSFNWDPLLPYAYRRNGFLRTLPSLWFLHGNVKAGACEKDNLVGWTDDRCRICHQPLKPVPLLYPISHKDYDSHPVLAESWRHFEDELTNAYFLTVFGYSAPMTDEVARERFIGSLRRNTMADVLQLEIVDPNAKQLLKARYSGITDNLHASCLDQISQSWLSMHPRLTCEALFQATMMMEPIRPYEMPKTKNLYELQEWYAQFSEHFPNFYDEIAPWNRTKDND